LGLTPILVVDGHSGATMDIEDHLCHDEVAITTVPDVVDVEDERVAEIAEMKPRVQNLGSPYVSACFGTVEVSCIRVTPMSITNPL
jgi:hypothetical protein